MRAQAWVPEAGTYDLVVTLRAKEGATASAHTLAALEPGDQELAVDFEAAAILALGADGPWTLATVRLDRLTGGDRRLQDRALEAGATDAFAIASFRAAEAR